MNTNRNQKKQMSPGALVLILLFFIFPPLAFVGAVFLAVYNQSKKNGGTPTRTRSQQVQDLGETLLRRMKEGAARQQPGQSHSHTPMAYSYDSCAREKRLEQLKVLRDAGLLDVAEYQQCRQEIEAMR